MDERKDACVWKGLSVCMHWEREGVSIYMHPLAESLIVEGTMSYMHPFPFPN